MFLLAPSFFNSSNFFSPYKKTAVHDSHRKRPAASRRSANLPNKQNNKTNAYPRQANAVSSLVLIKRGGNARDSHHGTAILLMCRRHNG
jgi:hypothetical protein